MSLVPAFEIGVCNAWIFTIWLLIQTVAIRLVGKEVYQRAGYPPDFRPSHANRVAGYISNPFWLLSTAYSIFLPFKLNTAWFYIGLVIFLVGLVINIIVTVNFATTPMDKPITGGIYSYSRHPGYASLLLIYLSVGIASASWIFLLVTIIWVVLLNIAIRDEERYCLERYGQAYKEYMNRTPRWIGILKS
jgi:protein-S-isoprenylcysteine O-methyltransferase Ste14